MKQGDVEVRHDLDNARWTNRKRENWDYILEFLPHSMENLRNSNLKEFWLQLGVISHEAGHHLFADRAGRLKADATSISRHAEQGVEIETSYFSGGKVVLRDVNIGNVISAIDEGYADLVAHFTFSSALNPYFQFALDRTFEARRVNKTHIVGNGQTEEKALNATVLQHFFSHQRLPRPQNTYSPDLQDEHAIGAIIANSLDLFFGQKFGDSPSSPKVTQKYQHVNQWVTNIQNLFMSHKSLYSSVPTSGYNQDPANYNSGPAKFLEDAMWEAVKLGLGEKGTLKRAQCETLAAKFPVYVSKWRGLYKCD